MRWMTLLRVATVVILIVFLETLVTNIAALRRQQQWLYPRVKVRRKVPVQVPVFLTPDKRLSVSPQVAPVGIHKGGLGFEPEHQPPAFGSIFLPHVDRGTDCW